MVLTTRLLPLLVLARSRSHSSQCAMASTDISMAREYDEKTPDYVAGLPPASLATNGRIPPPQAVVALPPCWPTYSAAEWLDLNQRLAAILLFSVRCNLSLRVRADGSLSPPRCSSHRPSSSTAPRRFASPAARPTEFRPEPPSPPSSSSPSVSSPPPRQCYSGSRFDFVPPSKAFGTSLLLKSFALSTAGQKVLRSISTLNATSSALVVSPVSPTSPSVQVPSPLLSRSALVCATERP